MADSELIEQWHTSDKWAVEFCTQASAWVYNCFDSVSNLFRVSIESDTPPDALPVKPNAATSLIALTITRCEKKDWNLQGKEWNDLLTRVALSRDALIGNTPVDILPLRSFGALPLFSTSYLAQQIPDCADPDALASNISYIIAIRRLLHELFEISEHNERSISRRVLHPFLLCNMLRAFKKLQVVVGGDAKIGVAIAQKLQDVEAIRQIRLMKRNLRRCLDYARETSPLIWKGLCSQNFLKGILFI
jgi:hypothetical protein